MMKRVQRWLMAMAPICLALGGGGAVVAATDDPGEFTLRATVPLNPEQRQRLGRLVREDAEAAALFAELHAEVAGRFEAEPEPLAVIHYEGLVNTDPLRVASVARLRRLDEAAAMLNYWQATASPEAAAYLRRTLVAWAKTYVPTGNDVNENKLHPLLVALDGLRDGWPDEAERAVVEEWLARLGALHAAAVESMRPMGNRYTKHLRLLATIGRALDEHSWQRAATAGMHAFIDASLRADGTSHDLEQRDSLTYHVSALRPLVELVLIAGADGRELYHWTAPSGGSIARSVAYVVPYATGERTREEWRNTRVELDRRRAAAGIEAYRPGRLFEPERARPLLEEASALDPRLADVALRLHWSDRRRFATWTMVVSAAILPNQTPAHASP